MRSKQILPTAEPKWQALVDAVPVGIVYLGRDRAILHANRQAQELIGGRRRLDELLSLEPWATAARLCDLVLATGTGDFMEVADSSSRWWEITASPLDDSEAKGCLVLVLHDVTERVQLADKLRRRERLSDLGTLFHGISHRVRSSLFGVTGLIDVMLGQIDEGSEHGQYLEMQRRQIDYIVEVLDRVNQYAGPTEPNRTQGDLWPVLAAAIEEAKSQAAVENIKTEVQLESPVPVLTMDRDRLTLALSHILRNAFEHSPPAGEVMVRTRRVEGEADPWLCLEVGDQGPGIARDHKPRVFEPFFSPRSKSHGLGLSIARRIVEEHGGRIEVADRDPVGCLVTISLPIDRGRRIAHAEKEGAP